MLTFTFDSPFAETEKAQIRNACTMNYGIAAKAVEGAMAAMGGQHTEVDRVTEWFGTTYPGKVLDGARKMLEFISHGNVNFVDRRGKNLAKIHADGCAHNMTFIELDTQCRAFLRVLNFLRAVVHAESDCE